jgi:phosphate transport system permease protein
MMKLKNRLSERLIEFILALSALISLAVTFGILFILISESWAFFENVSLWDFLTDTEWSPLFDDARYGILPLLSGTLTTSYVALLVAIPIGSTLAIWLSEYASPKTREIIKPLLEILGGIPTVVYGYFALLWLTPILQKIYPDLPGFNMVSAGLVMGIMIIPYVSSLCEDAMRAVPMSLREGAFAMGATKLRVALTVVYPAAISGIASSYILAISRAVGETMIVAVAAGMQPNLTFDPTNSGATITAYIVQVALGDLPHGSIGYQSIFAAGLALFVLTLFFNLIGFFMRRHYRRLG